MKIENSDIFSRIPSRLVATKKPRVISEVQQSAYGFMERVRQKLGVSITDEENTAKSFNVSILNVHIEPE